MSAPTPEEAESFSRTPRYKGFEAQVLDLHEGFVRRRAEMMQQMIAVARDGGDPRQLAATASWEFTRELAQLDHNVLMGLVTHSIHTLAEIELRKLMGQ